MLPLDSEVLLVILNCNNPLHGKVVGSSVNFSLFKRAAKEESVITVVLPKCPTGYVSFVVILIDLNLGSLNLYGEDILLGEEVATLDKLHVGVLSGTPFGPLLGREGTRAQKKGEE